VSPTKILIETEKQAYGPGSEIPYRVIISDDDEFGRVNKTISHQSVLLNASQSYQNEAFDQQLTTLKNLEVFNGPLTMKENMKALRVNIFGPGSIRSETKLLKKDETHSEPSGYQDDLVGLHLQLSKTDVPFDEFGTNLTISLFTSKKRQPVAGTCEVGVYKDKHINSDGGYGGYGGYDPYIFIFI